MDDPRLMIFPDPRASMWGKTARVQRNTDFRLVAIMPSQMSSGISCKRRRLRMPALLTRMSMRPNGAGVGDVGLDGQRAAADRLDRSRDAGRPLGAPVIVDGDPCAFAAKGQGDGGADASARPRHHRHAALERLP